MKTRSHTAINSISEFARHRPTSVKHQRLVFSLAFLFALTTSGAKAATTLLDMQGTGNFVNFFGTYDGLTFTADGVGTISQFNYTGMPYSEGFVGIMDRNTGTVIPGSQISFGPSGTLATPFALDEENLYLAMFKTTDTSSPFRSVNQAQIPDDSGFINPEAPIGGYSPDSEFIYRGQQSYGTLGIQGSAVPEPSAAALAALGAASLLTRRRRKPQSDPSKNTMRTSRRWATPDPL